jgi:molecular chaperone DnaK (HSP70)
MFVASNLPLGRISLAEFPNTLQGELRVELTINVDSSGTITVAAKELATKKEDKCM